MNESLPPLPASIGPYKIIRSIARGGMGEVYLAYDSLFERYVALKQIRTDLFKHLTIRDRFLKEAQTTAQLTHPGIVSIYAMHIDEEQIYYTMPYIEGETFRQRLYRAKEAAQSSQLISPESSISALLPIFKSICQTVAYAHSREIIHRDLKPENILVGKFGEVIILDWGLAQRVTDKEEERDTIVSTEEGLTLPGKIVGTLAFMAPERVQNAPASFSTDIYALGVMLYQMLTLHLPFHRHSLKEFQKNHPTERLIPPEEIAPYRDVPPRLSKIVQKCLQPSPIERYPSVEDLIHDLMSYMEGRSEWFASTTLNIQERSDWELQENVLISQHMAITRTTEMAEWVSIMLSRASFSENLRIEIVVTLGQSAGIGFLFNVPESDARQTPLEGYCLWLGSEEKRGARLFRNNVEVMLIPDLFLHKETPHQILIEKNNNHICCLIDGELRLSYISYLPLVGTHVGILARDFNFNLSAISIFLGRYNLQVSCLAIPDAFLANKQYEKALVEYRRIAYSFSGYAESREALFRAGITLLEAAKNCKSPEESQAFFLSALEEFSKLHVTPSVPFEYLGKSLAYAAADDPTEEIKCLELAIRRYAKHPLIVTIKEQIIYRMNEYAQKDRFSAYRLILITLRHLPDKIERPDVVKLLQHLTTHWEPLPFFETPLDSEPLFKMGKSDQLIILRKQLSIPLAFWLASPYTLLEILHELSPKSSLEVALIGNILFALIELGAFKLAEMHLTHLEYQSEGSAELEKVLALLKPLVVAHTASLTQALDLLFLSPLNQPLGVRELRSITYLMRLALHQSEEQQVELIYEKIKGMPLSFESRVEIDSYRIWSFLQQKQWERAAEIFALYPLEILNQESSLLHMLYGCFLYTVENEEIALIHFAGVIDTPFPPTWALLGHELTNHILQNPHWFQYSFLWERRQLFKQLALFHQCADQQREESYFKEREKQEYVSVT